MPECQNCGSFVTEDYVRVFAPDGMERPRVCPNCEDLVRDGNGVREARAKRT
jgi:NAD-dependent SIR2 family protein deacetylase